jgi:hypothetical protein
MSRSGGLIQPVAYEAADALLDAETATLHLSNRAYEYLWASLSVGANIMIRYAGEVLGFAAYAKVKSVKADQNGVDVELTTDGMNIKGVYAERYIKEQFGKMKSGGVKVYVFPHSDDVNVIRPNFIEWVLIGGLLFGALRVELEVRGDKIRMKAKEAGVRVMTYDNATDTFSSISIKTYFSMLNKGGAILLVQTRDGDEMRFGAEVLGRSQGANYVWWSLKVNDKLMSKMTRDMIIKGGTDYSYYVGVSRCRDCFQTL